MPKVKSIDYLSEDPVIPTQKFALVSIVGPHMPQKCDVWGLKVRGTAENLEKAKILSQKLLRIDNNYDIYTVEVGKFFPLAVEPNQIGNVEYQNSQLNEMVKKYLENKELANEMWHQRKNEMIQEAIKEGKQQDSSKPEHPIAVLQRIKNFETQMNELNENLNSLKEDLELSKTKFANYTDEERELANKELEGVVSNIENEKRDQNEQNEQNEQDNQLSIEEIRKQLMDDLNVSKITEEDNTDDTILNDTINKIKSLETELDDLYKYKQILNEQNSPNVYKHTTNTITRLENELGYLKDKLNDKEMVNSYINSNYNNSQYNDIF